MGTSRPWSSLVIGDEGSGCEERSLPTPEVRGSNPVTDRIYIEQCQLYLKDENKGKRGLEWSIFENKKETMGHICPTYCQTNCRLLF